MAVILVVVPILGVRKSIEKLALNWQEVALYVSSVFSGAMAGLLIMRCKFRLLNDRTASKVKVEEIKLDIPKEFLHKSKLRVNFILGVRTKLLLLSLYLLLYVSLCGLCQRFHLGLFVFPDAEWNNLLRSLGACLVMTGLYLILRALRFSKSIPFFVESSYYDSEMGLLNENQLFEFPKRRMSHIPPVRLSFFADHPICLGWTFFMTGLPLIFQAWFPLIALPGVIVVFNWVFGDKK